MDMAEIYDIKGNWACKIEGSTAEPKYFPDMTFDDACRSMRNSMDGGYASVGKRILSEDPITVDVIGDFWSFTVKKVG